MRPKKPETTRSGDLFRARLDQIINLNRELAQLAGTIDWDFDRQWLHWRSTLRADLPIPPAYRVMKTYPHHCGLAINHS